MLRTHTCGQLNESDIGRDVVLCGWVHSRRDHGELIFIDLRDRYGITQIVFDPETNRQLHTEAHKLRSEYVILVKGRVEKRPKDTENPKLSTGKIEVRCVTFSILSGSESPIFEITDNVKISEDIRIRYRYLDIRRPSMLKRLILRHRICKCIRDYLDKKGYLEIETPILTKSTPEGARDFLVPSRLTQGTFYALPQSPQLFKQILMVAGVDKYFQLAKCFRDEDLRADRQPEFTQLDIEASFVEEKDIFLLCEGLMSTLYKEILGVEIKTPFDKISYTEAIERFGTDKPDLRFGCEIVDLTTGLKNSAFNIFREVATAGGRIKAINIPGGSNMSLKKIEELTDFVANYGAKGLAYFKVEEKGLISPIAKFFTEEEVAFIKKMLNSKNGDMVFIIADANEIASLCLGSLRNLLGNQLGLIENERISPLWIYDFPLFKYNDEEKRWDTEHHPFTAPKDEELDKLDSEIGTVKAKAYDLVINGAEVASGSIRIHNREIQEKVFRIIGITKKEADERFGFLLRSFQYGVPPHGGIAFGLDRLITLFTNDDSIRDVIPFPKTQKGVCPLTGAPSSVSDAQLRELGIRLRG